ncbi:MAG TPA: nicotinate (nicotinamide) nucleotide adenylyltransferase [Ruminococcus sp.]|nr:nicotinate (nicotinamide) nucleotide adenylyltransferase [Ruminococcus sp.]
MKRRLGLFGGSFNPIHNGHLHLAEAAKNALRLSGVMLMPAGEAPHKSSDAYAPAADRLAMCQLAAEKLPWLSVSDLEIRKAGKSYTVDTLRMLTQEHPDTEWTLLIGSDMLLTFDTWYCWQEILQMASLCAVSREKGDLPQLRAAAASLRERAAGANIRVVTAEVVVVSSTQIRTAVQKNADCSCLLPENVVQYIQTHGLYRLPTEQ